MSVALRALHWVVLTRRAAALVIGSTLAVVVSACGSSSEGSGTDGSPSQPVGTCNSVTQQHAIAGYTHVPVCSPVSYGTNPPSSGNHYPIWAAYQSYTNDLPEGFWVHNLEHGAVVFSYNCPSGCASDIAAAQALIDALPDDAQCDPSAGDARVRMVMTPDPGLDVKFAASSWGWTLRADCFDPVTFGAFVQAHYAQGREAICGQGENLSSGIPASCGE